MSSNERPRELTEGLHLSACQLSPNPVTSGNPVNFEISLKSLVPVTIHDFHFILNDPSGLRVALIDLRDKKGPYAMGPGQELHFVGTIARLPLVGGSYSVGLVLRTGSEHQEFYDRYFLEVRPPPARMDLVPYAAQYQGTTVLDYTFQTSGLKMP
jgi:hypothetical protein